MSHEQMLVIGAGPVGLAMAAALKRRGIPYTQAEATDHVGGNWAHGVYETAHIISSRKTTEYPGTPMPADWPDFPSAQQMARYYRMFADTHRLDDHLQYERPVQRVEQAADQTWRVTFEDGATEPFKGVVVCNGHHWAKAFPPWAQGFGGELLHSKDYKRPAQLAGKRVLVIGGGNSGCDIVSEAARVADADWSLRRGYWFIPKTFLGRPTVELLNPWLPMAAQRKVIRGIIRATIGKYSDYGLPMPDHRIFEAHPTISSEVFHYLKHGRIRLRRDVAGVDGKRVRFVDGEAAEYDLIVCATGFDVRFPMLPDGMVPVHGKAPALVGGMVRPDRRHLWVMGAYQARYGLGPLVEPLGELLCDWIALQDAIEPPLGAVLRSVGIKIPRSHLVGPFETLRKIRAGRLATPVLRRAARRVA